MQYSLKLAGIFLLFFFARDLQAQPRIGKKAPNIILSDSSGTKLGLYDIKAKWILIDFWASWCGPCRKSNKEILSTYQKYHPKGFEIYGVSLDKNQDDWRRAIRADKIHWIQVGDSDGWEAPIAIDWKIDYLPTSFLLNENKEVVAINPTRSQIERHLKKLRK